MRSFGNSFVSEKVSNMFHQFCEQCWISPLSLREKNTCKSLFKQGEVNEQLLKNVW